MQTARMATSQRWCSLALGIRKSSSLDSRICEPGWDRPRRETQSGQIEEKCFHVIQITDRTVPREHNCRRKGKEYASPPQLSLRARCCLLLTWRDRRWPSPEAWLPRLSAPPFVSKPRRLAPVRRCEIQLPRQMIHPEWGHKTG